LWLRPCGEALHGWKNAVRAAITGYRMHKGNFRMGDFDGRIILVTGSATGLGAAIAVGAAKRGAKAVLLNYSKSRQEAEATADAVRAAGAGVEIAQGDVAEDADCRRIAEVAARFGRLDALVNNAGITKHVQNHADLDGLSKEDFLRRQHRRSVPDAARLPAAAGSRRTS
jgi:NAD(P)-dependent dehydrogenase (short-subunit alcohol dehydrogenase family)